MRVRWLLLALTGIALAFLSAQRPPERSLPAQRIAEAYSAVRDHALWHLVRTLAIRHSAGTGWTTDTHSAGDSIARLSAAQYQQVLLLADLHGDLEQARAALRLVGATDQDGTWSAGQSLLVQLGDLVDRGNNSLGVLDLFSDLKAQAQAAGGKVVTLLGNHELMLITGDTRYVNREELRRLGRQQLKLEAGDVGPDQVQGAGNQHDTDSSDAGADKDDVEQRQRELLAGRAAWRRLMGPHGRYGSLLRGRPLMYLVRDRDLGLEAIKGPGDSTGADAGTASATVVAGTATSGSTSQPGPCSMLLVHAGVLEWMLDAVDELATAAEATLEPLESKHEAPSVIEHLEGEGALDPLQLQGQGDRSAAGAAGVGGARDLRPQAGHRTAEQYVAAWNEAVRAGLKGCIDRGCPNAGSPGAPLAEALLGGDGPVWSRALVQPSSRVCQQVQRVTQRLGVSRIVVGHTIQERGVTIRCGGRLLLADVGMSSWILGSLSGLRCTKAEGLQVLVPGSTPHSVPLQRGGG